MSQILLDASGVGEPQMAVRRGRIARFVLIIFEQMRERSLGGVITEFDDQEDLDLLGALRACSLFTDQIGCLNFDEWLVIQNKGIDGHDYIVQFPLFAPGFSLHAGRVDIRSLSLKAEPDERVDGTFNTLNVIQDDSERIKLERISVDRAFLVGMSMVIGLMDQQADDEDERLMPLLKMITPTSGELEALASRSPPPTVDIDDDDPY